MHRGEIMAGMIDDYVRHDPARGFANGYVQMVQASTDQVVPAIRTGEGSANRTEEEAESAAPIPGPPTWDVYGQARYRRAARSRPLAGSGLPEQQTSPVQLQPAPRAAGAGP